MESKHFRIRLAGRNDWMDLYSADIDLNDTKALLDEDMNPLTEDDGEEGELIYSLKEATKEARIQFQGKDWDLSNGEILISKRGGKKTQTEVDASIFDTGKESMPDCAVKVVRRHFDGSLTSKRISPTGKEFVGSIDKVFVAGELAGGIA